MTIITKKYPYLHNKMNNNDLNKIILSRNLALFCQMLENCSKYDKYQFFIKQQNTIETFLKENDWQKGLKLCGLFVGSWKLRQNV